MKSKRLLSCLVLLGATGIFNANAEVSAKLDEEGRYEGLLVRITGGRVWPSPMATATRRPLNPTGDILGDLAPTIVENPAQLNYPTAIWSHPNGGTPHNLLTLTAPADNDAVHQTDNFTSEFGPACVSRLGRPYVGERRRRVGAVRQHVPGSPVDDPGSRERTRPGLAPPDWIMDD